MTFELPSDWKQAMFGLIEAGGCAIVTGPTDVGKSTWCLALANACIVSGVKVAIIDADTGQSEIGPPCCIGMASPTGPFAALSDLRAEELFFTGGTSPAGRLLPTIAGISRLVAAARASTASQPHLIIVDMPGLATGSQARALIENTVSSVGADHLVAIARAGEMEATLSGIRHFRTPACTRLGSIPGARLRTPAERTTRRQLKLAAYFAEAQVVELGGSQCGISGTYLFAGNPLEPGEVQRLSEQLRVQIVHAESSASHLLIVTTGQPSVQGLREVVEWADGRETHVVAQEWYNNIAVGLADELGRHIGMGILQAVDFTRQRLEILTPVAPGQVRQVVLGSMRVSGDGRERGTVRPSRVTQAALRQPQGGYRRTT